MGDGISRSQNSPGVAVGIAAPPEGLLSFTGAGFTIVAATFGLARYSYGLFVPEIGQAFSLSKDWLGLIASAAYTAYMLTTIFSLCFCSRLGPRLLIVTGGLCAATGMALVAFAPSVGLLALGVILGGASPAFVYAPLSEAVTRRVPRERQNRSWTTINSGAASGVVIAGIAALSVASRWRWAWAAFAAAALITAAWNAWVMPPAQRQVGPAQPRLRLQWFLRADALPLFAFSFLAGVVTTIYWTFATSLIAPPAAGSIVAGWTAEELRIVFWTLLGAAGFVGAVGGDLISRFGLKRTIRAICLAMAAAIGAFASAPGSLPVLVVAAVVFGATFILVSGSIGVWSINIFNSRPSAGFGVTFLMFSVGALIGPAVAGACAGRVGLVAPFYGIMVGAITMATLTPRQDIWSAAR